MTVNLSCEGYKIGVKLKHLHHRTTSGIIQHKNRYTTALSFAIVSPL